jgi:hypothetical protein
MNIFIILIIIFIVFIYGRKFITNRLAKQEQMRAAQREANRKSWKDLGFF